LIEKYSIGCDTTSSVFFLNVIQNLLNMALPDWTWSV